MHVHQYIDRATGRICNEALIADKWVQWLYGRAREKASFMFKAATSACTTQWLAFMHFDMPLQHRPAKIRKIIQALNIDLSECAASAGELNSARKLFERKIKYWQCRPMPEKEHVIVAPADAKALVGSVNRHHQFFIKEKFFAFEELLGPWQKKWLQAFRDGSFAIFRLTPEKYHYNHLPVSGNVVDFYTIDGDYHSCNPAAVVAAVTPYSKNRRTATIIDTDVVGGTQVGLVAMVEVVALMIGEIVQAYSIWRYNDPQPVTPGMFVKRGQPKSLFRPGSSVDLLFFEPGRMVFDADLSANCRRTEVQSRFSTGFRQPLVETDVRVRSSIGKSARAPGTQY
jgi:phosphatidylserine decarboxylase